MISVEHYKAAMREAAKGKRVPLTEELKRLSGTLKDKASQTPEQTKMVELEYRISVLERSLHGIDASIEGRAVVAIINHMVRKVG